MSAFNLALAQMPVSGGDPLANVAQAAGQVGRAARAGAAIVLLPEALDCG